MVHQSNLYELSSFQCNKNRLTGLVVTILFDREDKAPNTYVKAGPYSARSSNKAVISSSEV